MLPSIEMTGPKLHTPRQLVVKKCPLLVLAGLAWLKLELRFEGLKQLATSNNMAGEAFAEQDHMPAALLRWEHAVEGGD